MVEFLLYIHTMIYLIAVEGNTEELHESTWVNLKRKILREKFKL